MTWTVFIGHPEAGQRSAIIYSILGSCRRHGMPKEPDQWILYDTSGGDREEALYIFLRIAHLENVSPLRTYL